MRASAVGVRSAVPSKGGVEVGLEVGLGVAVAAGADGAVDEVVGTAVEADEGAGADDGVGAGVGDGVGTGVGCTAGTSDGAGATIVKEPQDAFWGGYHAYFQDPDGYFWEVVWGPDFRFDEDGLLVF